MTPRQSAYVIEHAAYGRWLVIEQFPSGGAMLRGSFPSEIDAAVFREALGMRDAGELVIEVVP